MRHVAFVAVITATASLAGPVVAQTNAPAAPPAQPPSGGTPDAMPFDIPYGQSIGLERAKQAISAAKVVACNAGRFVGAQGIQLHGGIGMTEEHSIGHYYKKLVAFEKRFGDTEFHLSRYLQHATH